MRKIARFNLLLSLLFFLLPFSFALLFLSLASFLPPLVDNYRIYTPDSLLSCIIGLIPKFLSSFALASLSIFFISFPLIFLLLLHFLLYSSFLFLPFPLFLPFSFLYPFPFSFPFPFLPYSSFFFTLLWLSSLALRSFDSFPPGGSCKRIYSPAVILVL